MLGVIHSHVGMLYTMWVVLIVVALAVVAKLVTQLRLSANWDQIGEIVTRPMLLNILPLIILSWLTAVDPTGIFIRIWYYVVAVVIIVRSLIAISKFVRK